MQDAKQLFQGHQFLRRSNRKLSKKVREPKALLKSAVALVLIVGCLWASQWQFQRGIDRHQRNSLISSRIDLKTIALKDALKHIDQHSWQNVRTQGQFNFNNQVLLRNHYNDGVYGFELLTEFQATTSEKFWVDCGWVKAGETAKDSPVLPELPHGIVEIEGRLRTAESLPQGSLFAIPVKAGTSLAAKADALSGESTNNFYVDLLSGSDPSLTPSTPAELPELSDGPHMAYAVQWLLFAGLVIYGRFLIRRESLKDSTDI